MEEACGTEETGASAAAAPQEVAGAEPPQDPQEPGVSAAATPEEAAGAERQRNLEEVIRALQAELEAALAEVETVRAVATVSESTKQEAVRAVQRQCEEEVAILKDTIRSYEARLAALQQEQHGGRPRRGWELSRLQQHQTQGNPLDSLEREMEKAQEDSERLRSIVLPMEEEIAQLKSKLSRAEGLIRGLQGPEGSLCGSSESLLSDAEGPGQTSPLQQDVEGDEGSGPDGEEEPGGSLAFARGCDSVSIASSITSSPQPRRRPSPEHEDTASLLSTGTLVPESIYLPPPGFHLVPDGEWAHLQHEARGQQDSLQELSRRLEAATQEKLGLQEALRRSSEDCAKQVLVLLDQIQNSEQLLQTLKTTVSQTQRRTQEQIADLASSHKRLSYEVQRLSEENEGLRSSMAPLGPNEEPSLPDSVQELQALVRRLQEEAGALRRANEHQDERLRIEIVSLRERLEEEEAARARLQGVLETQLGDQREESRKKQHSLGGGWGEVGGAELGAHG
uniref:Rab GTPase-binding effector protein 2 n=1 Tax=Pelusios castaneus TaxID=367368 RepID=A0A8C8REA3_9SAUR